MPSKLLLESVMPFVSNKHKFNLPLENENKNLPLTSVLHRQVWGVGEHRALGYPFPLRLCLLFILCLLGLFILEDFPPSGLAFPSPTLPRAPLFFIFLYNTHHQKVYYTFPLFNHSLSVTNTGLFVL